MCALAVCLGLATPVYAQGQLYGTLVGSVTDTTGAALPGVTVAAVHAQTNLTRTVVSNENGVYVVPNIPTGTYTVTATISGFNAFRAENVVVEAREVRVDVRLSLSTVQETVTITATAAILQTDSGAVQAVTTSETLLQVPTSGRAFQTFLTTMPGVAEPNYQQSGGINNPARSMAVEINGQPATNTVFRLDGVMANNQFLEGLQSYGPSLEAIETVTVTSNAFDADQGVAGGATVSVQIKSGTNVLSGSAFLSSTDARMRERNYFLPATQSKGTSSVHVFGGTLGGPIIRNVLFFFFSNESTRQRTFAGNAVGQTVVNGFVSLPPADLRRGDFSGTGTVIYDPLTGNNGFNRVPFAFQNCPGLTSTADPRFAACNYIPADRISPIATKMLSTLPLPTLAGYSNNYFSTPSYNSDFSKMDTKITYAPSARLNLNVRLGFLPSWEETPAIYPNPDGSDFNPVSQGRRWDAFINSHSVTATSVLSPTWVVDGGFGYTLHNVKVFPPGNAICAGDLVGIPGSCQFPYSLDTSVPNMGAAGWSLNTQSQVRDYVDPQWQASANFSWMRGRHNIRFGMDYNFLAQNHYETQPNSFSLNGGATVLRGSTAANNFNRFADFLLGMPFSKTAQAMTPLIGEDASGAAYGTDNQFRPNTLRSHITGVYVRDQWQIGPKLTASIGLRWEYFSLPTRTSQYGLEVYDFDALELMICGAGGLPFKCGITVERNLFTPRLGLAWRPAENLVIRGGFSRNPQSNNPGRQQMAPSQAFPQTIVQTFDGASTWQGVSNFAAGFDPVAIPDLSVGRMRLPRGTGVNSYVTEFVRGKITSWNVSAQRALGERMSVTLGYVANRQKGMLRNMNKNYGQLGGGAASQPFQPLGITAAMNVFEPAGETHYDSLQLSFTRRMSDGLQVNAAYTAAKGWDRWVGGIAIPEYWYLNEGDSNEVPHKLNVSAAYLLPFGPGRKWLNGDGLMSSIAGGWQVNAFLLFQRATYVSVTSNANVLNAPGTNTQFPDRVKDGPVEVYGTDNGNVGAGSQYFDVTPFRSVTQVRFGNGGRHHFRGPDAPNLDLSVFRAFRMGARRSLQVRFEIFNVTNTPHFSNPSSNISNVVFSPDGSVTNLGGVGAITNTTRVGRQYDERELRLGVRFAF
jgi:hypothetical protein